MDPQQYAAVQMREKSVVRLCVLLLCGSVLIATAATAQQNPPDWATRTYNAPANQVFASALRSIQQQKHEVKNTDDKRMQVTFHVGTTAWSWGYNMMLTVDPVNDSSAKVTVAIVSKSGGGALSWGSGKKEVRKILAGIDSEIAATKSGLSK